MSIILLLLGVLLIFIEPYLFSAATGVPSWFLFFKPVVPPFSTVSLGGGKQLMVEVNPAVPTTLGELITVKVLDAQNRTPIEGAIVKVSKNDLTFTITTQSDGIAKFEYPGGTTVIFISKEGYPDKGPIVIPKIPDEWVTIRNYQIVTWIITILSTWIPGLFYKKRD